MSLAQDSAYAVAKAQYGGTAKRFLPDDSVVFGKSEQMLALRAKLRIVANSNLPVLIEGESGTGKEVIARLLHQWSPMAGLPFVHISCPAVPRSFFDRELSSNGNRTDDNGAGFGEGGRPSLHSGGTLCFDEIGELEASLQAKLLQLLQDGNFASTAVSGDQAAARIVCATDRDLETAVAAGEFRRDLFYRINVVKLELPPLRERAVDLPDLCGYFLHIYNEEFNCSAQPLSPELVSSLQRYKWPGNIRQLANLMKRYVVLDSDEVLRSEIGESGKVKKSIPEIAGSQSLSLQDASRQVKKSFERQEILRALEANQWNRKRAARALNISYRALLYKLKECRLQVSDSQ